MSDIAVIAPLNYLEMISENEVFLVLPQFLTKYSYSLFHRHQCSQGKWIILDNGMLEGKPFPIDRLVKLAREIGATEVVLPDEFKKPTSKTLLKLISQLSEQDKRDFTFMIVPHGNGTIESFNQDLDNCKKIADDINIGYRLGIPYREMNKTIWRLNYKDVNTRDVHWLGCFSVAELALGKFRSIDTSLPFRCAYLNEQLTTNFDHFNFEMRLTKSQLAIAENNIDKIRALS